MFIILLTRCGKSILFITLFLNESLIEYLIYNQRHSETLREKVIKFTKYCWLQSASE